MDENTSSTMLKGKSILVTGGTGSFGQAFVRTVLQTANPEKIIVYSRDEYKQVLMASKFEDPRLRLFIGDVRDLPRLELAMREVDYVIHAAALKHVPVAEYNPMECVNTNVLGADHVVRAALRCGVEKVITLSTDKASSPINLYGATKLVSDKIFIASNSLAGDLNTRFSVVRYGNVLGSRGSVINIFKEYIAKGIGDLPITDERMTRFWITLPQAVDFVLSCLRAMHGGELFVPKIPSMRIVDLAQAMTPNLSLKITGVRPGEKLHEVMITADDARTCIELEDRYVVRPMFPFWDDRNYMESGKTVPEGFCYASNTNSHWLDKAELRLMVEELDR